MDTPPVLPPAPPGRPPGPPRPQSSMSSVSGTSYESGAPEEGAMYQSAVSYAAGYSGGGMKEFYEHQNQPWSGY